MFKEGRIQTNLLTFCDSGLFETLTIRKLKTIKKTNNLLNKNFSFGTNSENEHFRNLTFFKKD